MDGLTAALLALAAIAVFGGWTLLSANAGRRAARWGRRWLRRLLAVAVLLIGAILVLMR